MIILLNGTSSSGKTTIGKVLQDKYDGVLLLYGIDTLVQTAFPEKCDYPPYDEQAIRVVTEERDGRQEARLTVSPYMYPVYEAAIRFYRMLSEKGYDLIVDEVLFDPDRVRQYFEILTGETVYFIGVKPEKEVVIRREQERGDRLVGLAAGLYDEVYHPLFTYDLTLDTGTMTAGEAAERILDLIRTGVQPEGFSRSRASWHGRPGKRTP